MDANEQHPLGEATISLSYFKCFGLAGIANLSFLPINVVIGRNNSGKSSIVDVLTLLISRGKTYAPAKHDNRATVFSIEVTQKVELSLIERVFERNVSGGDIPGNHFEYGKRFAGLMATRIFGPGWIGDFSDGDAEGGVRSLPSGRRKTMFDNMSWPFEGLEMLRIAAERDIVPEQANNSRRVIEPNGAGATNLIKSFINSDDLPREKVEIELLEDLNRIYEGDAQFLAITCRENANGFWEIFLREREKGDIRLSESGSSLKSIFIILSVLILRSHIEKTKWKKVIVAVEEPENNLHPALLRRLLDYLADKRKEHRFSLLILTHSSVGIDWSSRRQDSQIIHVKHDGQSASARVAVGYSDSRDILSDLDIRASDILQANGVIWVEGPSDRIYLNRWIDLASGGNLREGVHYAIMFYGGKLLSHLDALPPAEGNRLISLLALNRNAALLVDSDRKLPKGGTGGDRKPRQRINATKLRVKDEMELIGGFVWVTEGREIENYVSSRLWELLRSGLQPIPILYESVVEASGLAHLKGDKILLAHKAAELSTADDLAELDLRLRVSELCSAIRKWNRIEAA